MAAPHQMYQYFFEPVWYYEPTGNYVFFRVYSYQLLEVMGIPLPTEYGGLVLRVSTAQTQVQRNKDVPSESTETVLSQQEIAENALLASAKLLSQLRLTYLNKTLLKMMP